MVHGAATLQPTRGRSSGVDRDWPRVFLFIATPHAICKKTPRVSEFESRRRRVVVEHLDRIQRIGVEVVADERKLLQHVRASR